MSKGKKLTKEQFIEKSNIVHRFVFDYSKVVYINNYTEVIIGCPEHEYFEKIPSAHMLGQGCPKCSKIKKDEQNSILSHKKKIWPIQPEDHKLIPLSRGKEAKIDSEYFDKLKNINWYCRPGNNGNWYAYNNKSGSMHGFIMGYSGDYDIDHKNHDGLDNRKSNLRLSTRQQNCMNQIKSKNQNTTSDYKGVSLIKRDNKWLASIRHKGVYYDLGRYISEHDAANAYNVKAIELDKEHASTSLNVLPTDWIVTTDKATKHKSSKYIGVHWNDKDEKWIAQINHKHIGRFSTEKDAALKYNEACIEIYGVDSKKLNIIEE